MKCRILDANSVHCVIFFVPSAMPSERKERSILFFLQDKTWPEEGLMGVFVLPKARALEVWRGGMLVMVLVRSCAGVPLLLPGQPLLTLRESLVLEASVIVDPLLREWLPLDMNPWLKLVSVPMGRCTKPEIPTVATLWPSRV